MLAVIVMRVAVIRKLLMLLLHLLWYASEFSSPRQFARSDDYIFVFYKSAILIEQHFTDCSIRTCLSTRMHMPSAYRAFHVGSSHPVL